MQPIVAGHHINVGAIIRCAAGLGWDGVLLAPRAADPLYRRAIKTSMGSVFSMPWARMDDWRDGLATLQRAGFTVAALALRDDAVGLDEFAARMRARPGKLAILMGTEGAGLSGHWISQADAAVRIPMAHGIDSLNVAAAAAVACYALRP
ncbi:RRNA methylase family protein (TRNA/rRNA methyltransferase) [Propionibacterium freudenreichii]|uniref:RNA methyltransferase, TrmH family n=1 Tax=Propionibacterium freudenreichii TaxID=1744 RepID=A0A2C8ACI7_9ACTN